MIGGLIAVRINAGEKLAVERLRDNLVFGRNDQPACRDEVPRPDLLRDEVLELLLAEIIELLLGWRQAAMPAAEQNSSPSRNLRRSICGSVKLSKTGFMRPRLRARREERRRQLVDAKIVSSATANISSPAKSWRKPCAAASPK